MLSPQQFKAFMKELAESRLKRIATLAGAMAKMEANSLATEF